MPADFSLRSEAGSSTANRDSHYLNVVARLRPDVTIDQAREAMQSIAAQLGREFPDTNGRVGAVVMPMGC
jgi:hypothetical protein